jgi:histone H3/H4
MSEAFRVCSTCRAPIAYGAEYYRCSVSTCQRGKLALYFCSVPCWDAHVPVAGHRDAWAELERAPLGPTSAVTPSARIATEPRRRIVTERSALDVAALARDAREVGQAEADGADVLIVASKLKSYIRERSGMNTSAAVFGVLSEHLRRVADEAIREAAREDRKTVLDRDFEAVLRRRGGA